MSPRRRILSAAALFAVGAAACGGGERDAGAESAPSTEAPDTDAAAAAQEEHAHGASADAAAADLPLDSLASLARARAERMRKAAGHFRQMKKSVQASPELEEQMGTPAQLDAATETADLAAALAEDYAQLAERVRRAAADPDVTAKPGMEERLHGIRDRLQQVGVALDGIAGDVRALEDVVHGRGGEGHSH